MSITTKQPGIPVINILLLGNSGIGKGSLKWRYIDGHFPECIPKVYHLVEDLKLLNGTLYYLDVNDIAGDEEYDKLRPLIYSDKTENAVAIMCYAVNNIASFDRLKFKLIDEVRQFYGEDIPMIILGTKCDLKADINIDADKSKLFVSSRMVQELASETRISKVLTCSAVSGEGVTSLFDEAVRVSFLFRDSFSQKPGKISCCCLF